MLAALVLMQALNGAAPAADVLAAPADQARLEACMAKVEVSPEMAYEDAMGWAHLEQAREARWCAAQALVKLGRAAEAARRFESLAADQNWAEPNRLDAHMQAGNAWLMAMDGARAVESFDKAVKLSQGDPDALIDRARAYALRKDWPKAEEDLSAAIDKRGEDPLALMLRSAARMQRQAFDLAVRDAERAAVLAPEDIDVLVALGQAREALRLGAAPF
jgi:tetratricopeptide (TPR) repeat protein